MPSRKFSAEMLLKIGGTASPYLAVIMGVFIFKNGFFALFLYHSTLVVCIITINRSKALKLLADGFHRYLMICLGGLFPAAVILFLWPIAKLESVDLAELMESINLTNASFTVFALYGCVVNPFLEESFWRGCFKPGSWTPNSVDALFAGYHAIILIPVIKPVFVLLSFIALMIVAWLFRNIYRRTGGLAVPLLTHIIADIAILYAVWEIMQ